jgi:hypothetical protein
MFRLEIVILSGSASKRRACARVRRQAKPISTPVLAPARALQAEGLSPFLAQQAFAPSGLAEKRPPRP